MLLYNAHHKKVFFCKTLPLQLDNNINQKHILVPEILHPCQPSPCGPNSECREVNDQVVCSCILGYIGSPLACRPECTVNADCPQHESCQNTKCRDPCPGVCGWNAQCKVINHSPMCSCIPQHTGNPFVRCQIISKGNELHFMAFNLFNLYFFSY